MFRVTSEISIFGKPLFTVGRKKRKKKLLAVMGQNTSQTAVWQTWHESVAPTVAKCV